MKVGKLITINSVTDKNYNKKRRNSAETVYYTPKDISFIYAQDQEKKKNSNDIKDGRLKSAPQVLRHMQSEPVKSASIEPDSVEPNLIKPIDKIGNKRAESHKLMLVSSNYNYKFRGNTEAVNFEIPFYVNKKVKNILSHQKSLKSGLSLVWFWDKFGLKRPVFGHLLFM